MKIPDYYEVSVRLMKVLDTAGLAEKARWKRIEMWTQIEELFAVGLCENIEKSHIFGSQAEATTTSGLRSDTDFIYLNPDRVLQDLQSWEPGSFSYLMLMDDTTPPGYVKLQQVCCGIPYLICHKQSDILMLDRYGRSCLYNNSIYLKLDTFPEHHGPANTKTLFCGDSNALNTTDHVFAFRNRSWPHTASEWIKRHREHNWPSQETIFIIQQSGTLLVPVGQKSSPERHIEWRISVSYGEKILIWQFNSTQYKCYVLLKMINKHYIKPMFGENVLTSYHWKTCMFYMIEATPTVLWQPQNLLHCIDLCLMKMCTWVEESNCPNYFIPAENMFLDKVYGPVQRKLANRLHYVLRQNGRYLTMIPFDGIGQKLIIACQSSITRINDITTCTCSAVMITLELIHKICFELLRSGVQINQCLFERRYSSHAVRQEIVTILQRFYCSHLGSHLVSQYLKQQTIDQDGLDTAYELLLMGSSSDVASGKLKLATFHLLQNNVTLADNILQDIEKNYTFLVSNVKFEYLNKSIMLRIENENISTTDVLRYYVAFPVPFLPSEMHCTPRALIPEMFRSTGSYQGSLDPFHDYWQSWAVVDPRFYLHFLQYQCYQQQNKITHKKVALGNMVWVMRHESLKYKDTAHNLLAYCLRKDRLLVQSYAVLSKSMKLKNHHNAAKWQIACLLNVAFRWLGGRH
ncbi:hypothetical protein CHS0354_029821 [Potamilus streckersoni]|uniref:Mab-21-like HhH/H2TH-like domain-containing protein n=1 Tax=Potamilus streckersoni TaxID=2493646 RepID=A0AAE0WEF2_9BIVA|nr:hypothetical protein CHS0354_029821 [Potamilus streckersoni]